MTIRCVRFWFWQELFCLFVKLSQEVWDMEEKNGKKDFLNTYEAADRLGVAPATLRTWRAQGRGPVPYKFHRAVFYKADDLSTWIDEHYKAVMPKS